MKRFVWAAALVFSYCLSSIASAHFVWLVQSGDKVQVHFSESAEAPEPELLKNVAAAKVWTVVSSGRGGSKMVDVPLNLTEQSLSGSIDSSASAVVLSHE